MKRISGRVLSSLLPVSQRPVPVNFGTTIPVRIIELLSVQCSHVPGAIRMQMRYKCPLDYPFPHERMSGLTSRFPHLNSQ